MTTTGGAGAGPGAEGGDARTNGEPSAVADALREASFARLVSHADGDALAAAGTLAAGLDAGDVPYQVSAARTAADATRRLTRESGRDDATTVAVGFRDPTADAALPTAPSLAAHAAVSELGGDPDPVRSLAGHVAGGASPATGGAPDLVEAAGLEADPGVAVPTADLADGLAHTTLLRADWSGDPERVRALLADLHLPVELDADARRRVASLVAVDATADAPPRAAEAVERALRPLRTTAPALGFETLEGYADVLECVSRADPGTAIALVLGHDVREVALDGWREHAVAAHRAVAAADPARYRGVVVADGGPVWTVARLLRDFRSPEPAALAVGEGRIALATTDRDARTVLADSLESGSVGGRASLAYAETPDTDALADAVVNAL